MAESDSKKRVKRQQAERCVEQLLQAREDLDEAEDSVKSLREAVKRLEAELEGMLK
jgi:chromosome segregation ATPase